MARRVWSPIEDAILKKEWRDGGASGKRLARRFGRSEGAVFKRAMKLGLKKNVSGGRFRAGITLDHTDFEELRQAASEKGVRIGTLCRLIVEEYLDQRRNSSSNRKMEIGQR